MVGIIIGIILAVVAYYMGVTQGEMQTKRDFINWFTRGFRYSRYFNDKVKTIKEWIDNGEASEEEYLLNLAIELVVSTQKCSASFIQTHLKIGHAKAAKLVDELEKAGIVSPADGAVPRKVLVRDIDVDGGSVTALLGHEDFEGY